jgi:hypothetical protein
MNCSENDHRAAFTARLTLLKLSSRVSVMGWRFRRSVKIAPGVRWNFGTRGSSWSIGPRGFKLNFSNRGTRRTVSIPGTGISHSEMLGGPDRQDPGRHRFASPSPPAEPESSRVRVYGSLTDQTASEAVASWARREFPILGRMLPSVVTSIKRDTVERTDVQYTITRRQVVVRAEPLPRKVKPQGPAPNPGDFDAWTDVEKVLQLDPTIAVCPACDGEGSRQCPQCNGTVEFTCDICAGAGQIISERSGKLVKCRSCGGDGLKRCPCRDGFLQCSGCAGKGVAKVRLAVDEDQRYEGCVSGDVEFQRADLSNISPDSVKTTLVWTGTPTAASSPVQRALRDCPLNPPTLSSHDKVTHVRVETRSSQSAVVSYELAGEVGTVTIQGWSGELKPGASALQPLWILKRRLRRTWVLAFLGCLGLLGWFASRHAYYAESPATANLSLLALLLPVALLPLVAHLARPRPARSALRLTAYSLLGMFLFAMQVVQASTGPDLERAHSLRAAGQLEGARREALSAVEVGRDIKPAKALHDEIQLQLLSGNRNSGSTWLELQNAHFFTDTARRKAQDDAVDQVGEITGALLEKGDYRQSLVILAGVPAHFRDSPRIRERLVSARRLNAEAAAAFITSRQPLEQRIAACEQIRQPIAELATASEPFTKAVQIERACLALQAEQQRQLRLAEQAQLAERLRAERAAKAEQRRQQAASRAWATAPLLCRDGTLSPSCVCGGSRRGCCSHHGGVAGCSQ